MISRFKVTTSLAAVMAFAGAAQAQDEGGSGEIVVLDWGGAYQKSHEEAYFKPFTEETGIQVSPQSTDNPATPVKAQVEAGNVTADLASVEYADGIRLCDEGLVEEIDPSILEPGPDGQSAEEDFIEDAIADCLISTDVFSTIYAYNSEEMGDNAPSTIADFFDLEAFPGQRGMRKTPKVNLEMALMADGVAPDQVYETLETEEGVDQAFAKLDEIKDEIVWWEAGAQPPQLLADGEVALTTAYNGRIFNAAVGEDQPFEIVWDGQVYELEGWVIPRGAPNMEAAMEFVAFSTAPEQQATAAEWISYGPPRKSAASMVGTYKGGGEEIEMQPHLPTSEQNLENALASSYEFWADRETELAERFNAWLSQ